MRLNTEVYQLIVYYFTHLEDFNEWGSPVNHIVNTYKKRYSFTSCDVSDIYIILEVLQFKGYIEYDFLDGSKQHFRLLKKLENNIKPEYFMQLSEIEYRKLLKEKDELRIKRVDYTQPQHVLSLIDKRLKIIDHIEEFDKRVKYFNN